MMNDQVMRQAAGEIDRLLALPGETVLVAVEGMSASGKTSLARKLSALYDCNVFHMDDFFLRPEQRTAERFAQPGGNVDYERFLAEVLTPLRRGLAFSYRPFDCRTMTLSPPVSVSPKRLNLVEGAYSMHPALADAYDFSFFLKISAREQRARILRRNGPEMLERFLSEWIPLEETYFQSTRAPQRCGVVLDSFAEPALPDSHAHKDCDTEKRR